MPTCPKCKQTIADERPPRGTCPHCGHSLAPAGGRSAGDRPSLEATLEFESPPNVTKPLIKSPAAGKQAPTAATLPMPAAEPGPSITLAVRKLSPGDVALITGTWSAAISDDAGPRTSLKFDSKASTGMGSSLVVNPRGVRTVESIGKASGLAPAGADYELLEVIGKGGMGVVYAARQASVNRVVAVKMVKPTVAADAQRREKFLSEAVVTGELDHPNIVPIYELGTNEQNALFYSMKRVQGTPWSQVIGEKSLAENLEILMKVADAVAFAHSNGVIHRDLKPDNVMLGDYGEVLVMDWGMALATSSFRHAEFVTAPDSMGGTPAYMAPEMVTGPFELIGPASDIYLLGAILYEVVAGQRPHGGDSAQACLFAAARNEIQPCRESGELVDIALRAMATEPAARYGSVREFQSALREYNSHCESISLSSRAAGELSQARQTGDYQSFAHALFGFQEALALWEGNAAARSGITAARLAYAESAQTKGDYELGISLLDAANPDHASLRGELEAAQRERGARQKWLTRFKRIAAALVVLVFGVVTISLIVVAEAKNQESAAKDAAIQDKIAAEQAEQAAQTARQQEEEQKNKAIAAEAKARQEEALARAAELEATNAREEERVQRIKAVESENKARAEERKAVVAKQGEEYAAYVARIGMAAAKIDENAFDAAESLLAACLPQEGQRDLRHWEWGYLARLCRQGVNLNGQGTVSSVAFAPDGTWFVTAGEDGQAHVWDRATKREMSTFGHADFLHAVAVSPDGQYVATAGGDGRVRIARAKDGTLVHTLSGHTDRVLSVAFSPRDGRWLLTASRDKTARLWDTATGSEIAGSPLGGHSWWVWSAVFSPDEKQIATAGQDGKVMIWSFEDGQAAPRADPLRVFLGHTGPVFAVAFSPDGRQVASAGHDKRVLVWQPDKIENVDFKQLVTAAPVDPQASRSFEGHSAPVRSLSFSADGQYVLSGGDDNTVRVWDATTGKLRTLLRGHSRPVQSCVFSPDGRQVVSAGQEGQIKLWNMLDYKEVRAPQGRVLEGHDDAILAAAFSSDGGRIVTASRDHTAGVYDAQSGKSLHRLKEGHEFLASRAIFFAGGRRLLTSGGDNSTRIWDAATGTQLSVLEGTGRGATVAVSRDSNWILTGVSASDTGTKEHETEGGDASRPRIALWNLDADGKAPRPHVFDHPGFGAGHRRGVTAVAISPDRRWLFSGDDAGVGKLWDAASGREFATLQGHASRISAAEFLPDSRRLLTASHDGTVALWDVATGKKLPEILRMADADHRDAYDVPVVAMALSADGRQLLTLSEDTGGATTARVVRLWDMARGSVVYELYRGGDSVTSIAFADSDRAALAAGGSFVRRWDLASGSEQTAADGGAFLDFRGRREAVWSALEAPDGPRVLTVGGNGAALWDPSDSEKSELVFRPHSGVTSAGFSADGRWIVTGSSDRRVKVWNAETGLAEFQLPAEHTGPITSARFSPLDSSLLVTASVDGTARVWDVSARRVMNTLRHHEPRAAGKPVRQAIFSPDGRQVITVCEDATVRFWESATGELKVTLRLAAPGLCVASSADGRRILVGLADGTAMIYDAVTQRPLVRYLGHTAAIHSVALSPDGRRALTGSADRSAKLWDTDVRDADPAADEREAAAPWDGKEIVTLRHHDQAVTSVAFSPDGRSLLTAGLDGTALVWLTDDWQAPNGE